jgi:hypothetical protein
MLIFEMRHDLAQSVLSLVLSFDVKESTEKRKQYRIFWSTQKSLCGDVLS